MGHSFVYLSEILLREKTDYGVSVNERMLILLVRQAMKEFSAAYDEGRQEGSGVWVVNPMDEVYTRLGFEVVRKDGRVCGGRLSVVGANDLHLRGTVYPIERLRFRCFDAFVAELADECRKLFSALVNPSQEQWKRNASIGWRRRTSAFNVKIPEGVYDRMGIDRQSLEQEVEELIKVYHRELPQLYDAFAVAQESKEAYVWHMTRFPFLCLGIRVFYPYGRKPLAYPVLSMDKYNRFCGWECVGFNPNFVSQLTDYYTHLLDAKWYQVEDFEGVRGKIPGGERFYEDFHFEDAEVAKAIKIVEQSKEMIKVDVPNLVELTRKSMEEVVHYMASVKMGTEEHNKPYEVMQPNRLKGEYYTKLGFRKETYLEVDAPLRFTGFIVNEEGVQGSCLGYRLEDLANSDAETLAGVVCEFWNALSATSSYFDYQDEECW